MVVTRVGNTNIDKLALEELQLLAAKGISNEELENVVSDYENQEQQKVDATQSFEMKREEFKRERAQENFKSGSGSFRRG